MDKDSLLTKWNDLPIRQHLFISEYYIVFINENDKFDWKVEYDYTTEPSYVAETHNRLLIQIEQIEIMDANIESQAIRDRFKQLLGSALTKVFQCDYKNAESAMETARKYIIEKNYEVTRIWILLGTLCTTVVITVMAFLVRPIFESSALLSVLSDSLFGSIGVLIFSFLNLTKLKYTVETGKANVIIESVSRVFIGIFIAFVGLLAIHFKLLLAPLDDANIKDINVLFAILLAPSEKLIPSLFQQFDDLRPSKAGAETK